jgi:superfamily II DNA helicase RecQ
MRLHFVTVPIHDGAAAENDLNQFLGSRRVVSVDRHLVPDGTRSAWAICVTYLDGGPSAGAGGSADPSSKKRLDYREVLPPAEYLVFAKLRDLRKQLAERDGVPPYAVFTNEQLADMVRLRARSAAELARIEGIGPARIEKYSVSFLEILCAAPPPAPAT